MCRSCSAVATAISDAAAALKHEGNSRRRWCRHDVQCEFAAPACRSLHLVVSLERIRVRTACTCHRPPCSGQVAQKLGHELLLLLLRVAHVGMSWRGMQSRRRSLCCCWWIPKGYMRRKMIAPRWFPPDISFSRTLSILVPPTRAIAGTSGAKAS